MKPFFSIAKNLLFPPRCAGCHTLLPPTAMGENAVLCTECLKQWRTELCVSCPECFAAYPDCRCQPSVLKRAGSAALLKLAPYGDSASERVMHRIVWDMKKQPRRRVVAMLAKELATPLLEETDKLGWEKEQLVLVHLPRDRRKVRRYGVDQAEMLARALAKEMHCAHLPLLYRTKRVRMQKSLSAKERMTNLHDAFAVRAVPSGCCVVLVDDVVTTGASLSAGARALRTAGVKNLLCVTVAQTPKKR